MGKWLTVFGLAFALGVCAIATAEDDDFIMGNYKGTAKAASGESVFVTAQVAAMPGERFRAVLLVPDENGDEKRCEIKGKKDRKDVPKDKKDDPKENRAAFSGSVNLDGSLGTFKVTGGIYQETFTGEFKGEAYEGTFEMKRTVIASPTLGMAPPEGAIVLMDGKSSDAWNCIPYWQVLGDGAMGMRGSSLVSKQEFGSAQYHVEFKCPFMPNELGQARGNSGCYVMGRYEVQVLDSFADLPADNLCGGIYKEATPTTCASAPPLQWQTYDITFTAPKFENGQKTANARITVVHNGVTIHNDVELKSNTPGGVSDQEAPAGPLMFQDHGNDVNYRNIWVKPIN